MTVVMKQLAIRNRQSVIVMFVRSEIIIVLIIVFVSRCSTMVHMTAVLLKSSSWTVVAYDT